jgi:glycosyltransferase involved in cell wall biosynthesis
VLNELDATGLLPRSFAGPVVLDLHNIESQLFASFVEHVPSRIRRLRYRVDEFKASHLEAMSVTRASVTWSCSTEDRKVLTDRFPDADIRLVSNGAEIPRIARRTPRASVVLLVASFNHPPNLDAARWFLEESWPHVRERVPNATFVCVGREANRLQRYASQDCHVYSDVPSVQPYYEQAAVVIAPLRFGGGTKLKVLEALAHALPVVGTSEAVRGLQAPTPVFVRDDPVAVAREVVSLLTHPEVALAAGASGREWVAQRYSWAAVTARAIESIGSL